MTIPSPHTWIIFLKKCPFFTIFSKTCLFFMTLLQYRPPSWGSGYTTCISLACLTTLPSDMPVEKLTKFKIYANQAIPKMPTDFDEAISAAYVFPGCRLEAWHDPNYIGILYKQISGYQAIPHHNDKFSSVKCYCE